MSPSSSPWCSAGTQPSLTPPTAAELLAEQADRAVTFTNNFPPFVKPGTWLLRKLATSSGNDVAGDCNAVNAMLNIIAGYANRGGSDGDWFLMLADVPGVTVQQMTDVTGQADVAFRYPFADGITEILFNAGTHVFAGYVRSGVETIITKEVAVSGPGSTTPAVIHPR